MQHDNLFKMVRQYLKQDPKDQNLLDPNFVDVLYSDYATLEAAEELVAEDCHIFYFPKGIVMDSQLVQTADCFINKDVFQPPFKNCFYVVQTGDSKESDDAKPNIGYHCHHYQVNDGMEDQYGEVTIHEITWYSYVDDSFQFSKTHCHVQTSKTGIEERDYDTSNVGWDDEKPGVPMALFGDEEIGRVCRETYLSCTAALSAVKYVEREFHDLKKLNKKRITSGKSPLRPYSVMKLTQPKSTGRNPATGKGTSPCPHWRKGHTRTMSDGRDIPIPPCYVNWNGSDPINNKPTKIYE